MMDNLKGKIFCESVPSWQRYRYLKVLKEIKRFVSNFGKKYVDCKCIEVGRNKVRDGVIEYRFALSELYEVTECEKIKLQNGEL